MADAKAAADGKSQAARQEALVQSIAAAVRNELLEFQNNTATFNAQLMTDVNSILARLEILEAIMQGKKRTVNAERKTGAGAKKPAAGKAAGSAVPTNAMLYFRYAFANIPETRERWLTEESQSVIDTDDYKNKAGEELLKAQAGTLWKKFLTDADKKEIKDEFTAWKNERGNGDAEPQLDEDGAAAEGADDGAPDQPAATDDAEEPEVAPPKPAPKVAPKAAAKAAAPKAPAKAAAPKAPAKAAAKPAPKKA